MSSTQEDSAAAAQAVAGVRVALAALQTNVVNDWRDLRDSAVTKPVGTGCAAQCRQPLRGWGAHFGRKRGALRACENAVCANAACLLCSLRALLSAGLPPRSTPAP